MLRIRLALVVAALMVVVVVSGSVVFSFAMVASTRATLEHSLQSRDGRVDAQLRAHLLPLVVGAERPLPTVDESIVQIVAPTGELLYTTAAAGSTSLVSASLLVRARREEVWTQIRRPRSDNPYLVLAGPSGVGMDNIVVVGGSLDQVIDTAHRVYLILAVAGPLAVVASIAGAWLLAGGVLRPVERLRTQVEAISASDPQARIAQPGARDELATLVDTFNGLLDRVHEALDRQRQFVAAASHELRTPLAALGAELEMAARSAAGNVAVAEMTSRLAGRVAQLVRLSDGLLILAQADEGVALLHVNSCPLEPLVAASLSTYRGPCERGAVTLALDAYSHVVAPVDTVRFRQVVENLVDNAIRYSPRGGLVEVGLRLVGDTAIVDVRDQGPGVPPDFLPRAFERFSRSEPSRPPDSGGAGLGLAIVWTIVHAHGGTVTLANAPGGGALATVSLPRAHRDGFRTDDAGPIDAPIW